LQKYECVCDEIFDIFLFPPAEQEAVRCVLRGDLRENRVAAPTLLFAPGLARNV
jgi:hypothetical protein